MLQTTDDTTTTAVGTPDPLTTLASEQLDARARRLIARMVAYAMLALRPSAKMDGFTIADAMIYGLGLARSDLEPLTIADDEIGTALATTAGQLGETLDALRQLAHVTEYALADRPRGLDDIVTQLLVALAEFERASAAVGDIAKRWGDEALTGPALKQECMAAMISEGMSRSAAKDAVTSHPRYAQHKERLDDMARAKHDAETAQTTARVRVGVLQEVAAVMRTAVPPRA